MIITVVGAELPLGNHLAAALNGHGHKVTALVSDVLDLDAATHGRPDPDVLVITALAEGTLAFTQAADIADWAADHAERTLLCVSAEAYPAILQTPPLECYEVIPGRPPRTITGARAMHETDWIATATALNVSGSRDRIIEMIFTDEHVNVGGVTTARIFGAYGYDHGREDEWIGQAVHTSVANVLARQPQLYVVDDQTLDMIHLDDVVGALVALVEQQVLGPVNIGTGTGTSMLTMVSTLIEALGDPTYAPHIELLPADGAEVWQVADPTRMARIYQPTITVAKGLRRQLAYQRDSIAVLPC